MNLTNERLKEIAESDPRLGLTETEWKSIAAELLRWRNLRDAGDEAVTEIYNLSIQCGFYPSNPKERQLAVDCLVDLRDIAIARGRTRTDAVNRAAEWAKECEQLQAEVERLKTDYKSLESQWLHEKENVEWNKIKVRNLRVAANAAGRTDLQSKIADLTEEIERLHDEAQVADSLALTLQEEVKMLAKERDEAWKELEHWRKRADWLGSCYKDKTIAGGRVVIVLDGTKVATHPDGADVVAGWIDAAMEGIAGLPEGLEFSKQKIERLTAELAELRKAPGIEEVDACMYHDLFSGKDVCDLNKLFSVARRAIAARDEVVGLLKWIHGLDMILDDGLHPIVSFADSRFSDSEAYAVDHRNAKRILEIVGGGGGSERGGK